MISKIYRLLLFLLFIPFLAFSQSNTATNIHHISGYVIDRSSAEPLLGVHIVEENSKEGAVSNNFGFFHLKTNQRKLHLRISYIGYKSLDYHIDVTKDTILNISLQTSTTLKEVEIIAQKGLIDSDESSIHISPKLIKELPALGGEKDVLRSLQLLPGIQSGSEGTVGLHVRGGSPDQNLILVDDVTIYNAAHLFGFMSTFNVDAIKDIKIIKSAFPAKYGGRLSSVLDISLKEGDKYKWHGGLTLSPIASKISVDGPLKKGKSSIVFSARRTFIDLFTRPISAYQNKSANTKGSNGYYFYDVDAKIHFAPSLQNRYSFSIHSNKDKYGSKEEWTYKQTTQSFEDKLHWNNFFSVFRWNHVHQKSLFIKTVVAYNKYNLSIGQSNAFKFVSDSITTNLSANTAFDSNIEDLSAKVDFSLTPSSKVQYNFGINNTFHIFEPGIKAFNISDAYSSIDTLSTPKKIKALEIRGYVEGQFEINDFAQLNAGLHSSIFHVNQKTYNSFEPRVSFRYTFNKKIKSSISFSKMQQYLHLLSNSGLGLPTDLWVPTTNRISPQSANMLSWSLDYSPNEQYSFNFNAYYKKMKGLISYKEGVDFLIDSDTWEDNVVTNGKGKSFGIELLLSKKQGRLQGFLSYTLSKTDRQFSLLNNGNTYPYKYDKRHDISLVGSYQLNKKWKLTATWVYSTGYAITLPESIYPSPFYPYLGDYSYFPDDEIINLPLDYYVTHQPTEVLTYSEKNKYRVPDYHRLDVEMSHTKKKEKYTRIFAFGFYNLYSRRNPYYITFAYANDSDGSYNTKGKFQLVSLIPVLPSISYAIQF